MIVLGIGCRRGCPGEEILGLVAAALDRAGLAAADALATAASKASEPGIVSAAASLALPLLPQSQAAMERAGSHTHSARVAALTGVGSLAEAAALAAAGADARLLLPRIASAQATCAIATGDGG